MSTRTTIAIGVGAAVLAIGAAAGVGALAANLAGGQDTTEQAGYDQGGPGGNGRGGDGQGRGGMDTSQLASALAEKLGVDEARVETALEEVMAADRPSGQPSGRPTAQPSGEPGNGRQNRGGQSLETIAEGLAEKLDLDEATVLAALQDVWPDQGGPGGGQPSGQPTQR
ncbi:MAG: hypothetical protein KDB60_14535 [Propionibacteriaceae bacterium]|nr:hypothetical protein [Propionibacteriaceae bacterium]